MAHPTILLCIYLFFYANIAISDGQSAVGTKETVEEFINKKIEVITKTTSTNQQYDVIELREPALSLLCDKTRGDKIKFVKDIDGYLFFLSVNELFAVKVTRDNFAERYFLGTLLDIAEEDPVLGVHIERWQSFYMVVIQQSTKLKVYLVKLDEEHGPEINHIHKMNFDSISDKLKIFRRGDDVLLVTYQIQEHAANKLTFYKWQNSFFLKESSDTTELPNKGDLFVYNENPDETLILSLGYGVGNETSHVTVFKYDEESNRWLKQQKMHFKKDYIEPYTIDGKLYLIGCFSDTICALYRWSSNTHHFQRHLKLANNVFDIIKSIYSRHSIIIVENFQNKLSFYSSNNITSVEPALKLTKSAEVSQYSVYKSPRDQLYFVEARLNETSMFISFYELTLKQNAHGGMRASSKEIDPIECILLLKKSLKSRASKVAASEKSAQQLKNLKGTFDINAKRFLRTRHVRLQDSKVHTLKMPYNVSVQTRELMQQSLSTNVQLGKLNQILRSKPRSEFRADDDDSNVPEEMESIVVRNLIYNGNQLIFKDILRKSQSQLSFVDQVRLEEITANKLVVSSNQVNRIQLDKLLNATKAQSITGTKALHSIKINELNVSGLLNSVPLTFLNINGELEPQKPIDFSGNINAKHLNVRTLNGFNMAALMSELYLRKNRSVINGDLFVKSSLNVKNLLANHIKSTPINDLFTTSTSQEIEADIFISKFHANVINANAVNNEDIGENFAVITQNNQIEIPTKFMTLNILDNLNIQDIVDDEGGDEGASASRNFVEMIKRHVIGTQTSDLSQIYNNKVVIRGTLTVADVSTHSPKTKIFVNNREVPLNISDYFWRRSVKQHISVPSFKINSAQALFSSGLVTQHLNRHPVDSFLLLNSEKPPQGPLFIRFEDAIVEGNVVTLNRNYRSMLYRLAQLAIHRDVSRVEISGPVEFRNQLSVKNLKTRLLNNVPVSTLVDKNLQYVHFDAVKAIENVEVQQVYVDKSLFFENYNNLNLEQFKGDVIPIDRPIYLKNVRTENFTARNLTVDMFEGHNFNGMMRNIQEELNFGAESKKGKRSIRIHGDAEFKSNIFIDFLNDDTVQFNEFIDLLAMKDERNQEIGGKKSFLKDLIVTESLQVETINDKSMDRLLHQSLSRGDKQMIAAKRVLINNLRVRDLHTNKFNNLTWNHFVDKTKSDMSLLVNLQVDEIETANLYTETATLDLSELIKSVKFPKRTHWNYVTVSKGSNMNFGDETRLDHLMRYGVRKNSNAPQEISGTVAVVNTPNFNMRRVIKEDGIVNTRMEAFNMTILDLDSVKNNSSLEIVTGSKTISPDRRFDASNLIIDSRCFFSSSYINEIDVQNLNRTIHRNEDSLNSAKHFENLSVEELYIENGMLNGVNPRHIVYVSSRQELPELNLRSLEVVNMQINTFNAYSFDYLLDTRLRKHGPTLQEVESLIIFNSIHFDNDTTMTSINNVLIDDAVFASSDQLQSITGEKIVNGRLVLKGPAQVAEINGVDFTEFQKATVSVDQDYRSDVPLQLPAIDLRNGMHVRQSINDRNVEELLSSDGHTPKLKDLVSLIGDVRTKINTIDSKHAVKRENRRMLYVDIDENVDFKYKPSNARSNEDDAGCGRQNELEFNPQSREVTISKRSGAEMLVELKSVKLRVTPNIICSDASGGSKTLELWWSYKYDAENKYFRNFSFPNTITDVKFTESTDGMVHMILVAQNALSAQSEITFLRLDKAEHDWQQHQQTLTDFYKLAKVGVVEAFDDESYVIVSTFTENSEGDKVVIYKLDRATNLFAQSQKEFIGASFDIILGINVKPKIRTMRPRTFLLFSRANGREIKIYRLKDGSKDFVFQRMLDHFSDNIVEVLVLYINEMPYFIVSQRSGLFCMYEWRGIESWQSKYCGRFENIQQMKSFEYLNRQHLFLASIAQKSEPSLNALAIYRQGDFFF